MFITFSQKVEGFACRNRDNNDGLRMIVQLSAAVSADGYLDDRSSQRLVLSSEADWDEVYALRARFDAVMVGAETVRRDNPSLRIKAPTLSAMRREWGLDPQPTKVTLTRSGKLDTKSRFFTASEGRKIVIVAPEVPEDVANNLRRVACVLRADGPIAAGDVVRRLEQAHLQSLLVEGGSRLLTLFLQSDVVDLLRLAVAPFFVGDCAAPRLVGDGRFPFDGLRRMTLLGVHAAGDMCVADYALSEAGHRWFRLREAIAEAALCPPSETAYSVGALIETADGRRFVGHSRETSTVNHAEEEALHKALDAGATLRGAIMYSSMEPCSTRHSKILSCTALIVQHGFSEVVFAAHEPDRFVHCCGEALLRDAGIRVRVIPELAAEALACNRHILDR